MAIIFILIFIGHQGCRQLPWSIRHIAGTRQLGAGAVSHEVARAANRIDSITQSGPTRPASAHALMHPACVGARSTRNGIDRLEFHRSVAGLLVLNVSSKMEVTLT
jgi:hypothetical protein